MGELMTINNYAVAQIEQQVLLDIIRENLGNTQITKSDLDRVKVPSGGGRVWEVPSLEGTEDVKALEGVVIFFKDENAYWADKYDGSNDPPDCYSADAIVGEGNPGGACAHCPLNQFGSDEESGGKACKNMRTLFLLREGSILPIAITVPPTSLKDAKKYFLRLASGAVPYCGVITELTLEKDKNNSGIEYSKIKFAMKGRLSAEDVKRMKALQATMRPMLESVQIEADPFQDAEA
ncbi:MAG: hypothetical protein GXY18_03720 [Methanomicrobiales archaeon]|nr:hypothetical protein [Methanomicrobiales archaeon]